MEIASYRSAACEVKTYIYRAEFVVSNRSMKSSIPCLLPTPTIILETKPYVYVLLTRINPSVLHSSDVHIVVNRYTALPSKHNSTPDSLRGILNQL